MDNITYGSGNVFEDVGFPPDEAADLLTRTNLMIELRRFIRERGWSRKQASIYSGEPPIRIKQLLDVDIQHFTVEQLMKMRELLDP
jgi:predicted XRE-type DNA-binding protein